MVLLAGAKKLAIFQQAIYQRFSLTLRSSVDSGQPKTTILEAFGHRATEIVAKEQKCRTLARTRGGKQVSAACLVRVALCATMQREILCA